MQYLQYGFQESADIGQISELPTLKRQEVKSYLQGCRVHTVSASLQLEDGLPASSGDSGYVLMLGTPVPAARRIGAHSHLWPEEKHVDRALGQCATGVYEVK